MRATMRGLGEKFKQADRLPADGAVRVAVCGEQHLTIEVTNDGRVESIMVSEFNASRVLAMLSLLLGVRLDKTDAKGIKL